MLRGRAPLGKGTRARREPLPGARGPALRATATVLRRFSQVIAPPSGRGLRTFVAAVSSAWRMAITISSANAIAIASAIGQAR